MAASKKPRKKYKPKPIRNPLYMGTDEADTKYFVVDAAEEVYEEFLRNPTPNGWIDIVAHLKYARHMAESFEEREEHRSKIVAGVSALMELFKYVDDPEHFKLNDYTALVVRAAMDSANAIFVGSTPNEVAAFYQPLLREANKLRKELGYI